MSDYNSMNFADEFNTDPEPSTENTPTSEGDVHNQTGSTEEEKSFSPQQSKNENTGDSVFGLIEDVERQLQHVCDTESIDNTQQPQPISPTPPVTDAELTEKRLELQEMERNLNQEAQKLDEQVRELQVERDRIKQQETDNHVESIAPESDLKERMERAERNVGDLIIQLEKSQTEIESYRVAAEKTNQQLTDSELTITNLKTQIEENASAVTGTITGGVDESVIASKDNCIEELKKEVEWNRAEVERVRFERDDAMSDVESSQLSTSNKENHLQLRVKRLTRARALLKRQVSENSSAAKSRQALHDDIQQRLKLAAKVQKDKEAINHAARCLSESERSLIRKWARPRSIVTLGWFILIAVVVAGGSWLAANKFFPATVSASLTVQAKPRPGFPITEDQAKLWNIWHVGQLTDEVFIKTAAKRFEDRKMEQYADPNVLKEYMQEHLSYDSPQPETIVLTLSDLSAAKAAITLEMIGITLVAESRRQEGKRTDGASSDIAEERKENGIKRYAVVNNVAVADNRLTYGAMIFAAVYGFILLLLLAIYNHLARAKKVFDAADFTIPDDILDEDVIIN